MKRINFISKKGSFFFVVLICFMMLTPTFAASIQRNNTMNEKNIQEEESIDEYNPVAPFPAIPYDTNYIPIEDVKLDDEQNDIGYNTDVGDELRRASPIYVGEPIEETTPGRGRTGTLDPPERDEDDYYRFTVCSGQTISASLSSSQAFTIELLDKKGEPVQNGGQALETGTYYAHVSANDVEIAGDYTLSIQLGGQNDAGFGTDAGNSIGAALKITPGYYEGYMDYQDVEDWYSFDVSSGTGVRISIELQEDSDYDLHLYDPSGNLVKSAMYYEDDILEYKVDSSGTWKFKIDMFPGWDASKWPDDYFLYGSGVYELELEFGVTVEEPIIPLAQPEIIPVAQTFIINDDPTSNKDEYAYLAAIPASNYLQDGTRYISPIVYQGVDDIPTWFTTIDQTTQYLIDDWSAYLARHDMTPNEMTLNADPIQAAADIATQKWTTSDTVVVTVDGSAFEDEIETVIDADQSISSLPTIERLTADDFIDVSGSSAKPTYIGKQWGAIHLRGVGDEFAGDTGLITPRYEGVMEDWWPYPYDEDGEDYDTFYPVSQSGFWFPYVTDTDGLDELQIIKYEGDRYSIPISDTGTSIEVTVTTDSPSPLIAYLIDPEGNVRRPMTPHYNGGEINPIHIWNGGHWQSDQDEFRRWILEPHTEFYVDVHNVMTGTWTAIVVPYLNENGEDVGYSGSYHVTINKRNYNEKRVNAAMSASNAAVIASINHAPLLYVTEDEVPSVTGNVINQLGVSSIIYVNIGDASSADPSATKELTTMQDVINEIKSNPLSENYITIVSLGTGDGYFAPAAMAAAYHIGPILNIGEAPEAFNTVDMMMAWREYAGDYYHGCRSVGHLPQLADPIDLTNPPSLLRILFYYIKNDEFPPVGLDLKLTWFGAVAQSMQELIRGYDLDLPGREAFLIVSPRDTDIRDIIGRALDGNESYAGHIPVETTAFSSDIICRDILYPALIYANPGRDVVTSLMANYPDGYTWQANDGNGYPNYATQVDKETFFSRGRFFEGHAIIENLLERYNEGAVLSYYTGHGTGGSGISGQYKNVNEQFPFAELRHENLQDFDWWDAWRGYSGYDNRQTKLMREGGESGYSSVEPALYDIVHFKWVDQLLENLHSEMEIWSSCTTGEHWGPIVYLSHGSAIWHGCAGSAYGVQDDLHNSWTFIDVLVKGEKFGESQSKYMWIFNRDFTTLDPTTLYGRSTLFQLSEGGLTNVKVFFGDPNIQCYAPDWIEPTPIEG